MILKSPGASGAFLVNEGKQVPNFFIGNIFLFRLVVYGQQENNVFHNMDMSNDPCTAGLSFTFRFYSQTNFITYPYHQEQGGGFEDF